MSVAFIWTKQHCARLIVYALIPLLLFAQSCASIGRGPCTGTVDPAFDGHWDNQPQTPRLILAIVYLEDESCEPNPDPAGLLTAVGTNTGIDSPWQRTAFTGRVTLVGEASVLMRLYAGSPRPDDPPFITIPVTLNRRGDTLSFDLTYEFEGQPQRESYRLSKRPDS